MASVIYTYIWETITCNTTERTKEDTQGVFLILCEWWYGTVVSSSRSLDRTSMCGDFNACSWENVPDIPPTNAYLQRCRGGYWNVSVKPVAAPSLFSFFFTRVWHTSVFFSFRLYLLLERNDKTLFVLITIWELFIYVHT